MGMAQASDRNNPPVPTDEEMGYYDDEEETLGSCGCVDYHVADCPTRTGDTIRDHEEEG